MKHFSFSFYFLVEEEPWRSTKIVGIQPNGHKLESQKQPLTVQGKIAYNRPFFEIPHWQKFRTPNCLYFIFLSFYDLYLKPLLTK